MVPMAIALSGAASLFTNGISNLGQSFVKKADTDNSGGVSLGEFASILQGGQNLPGSSSTPATSTTPSEATKAKFEKVDTNADGALSKDEINTYSQQLVSQLQSALVQLQQSLGAGSQQSGASTTGSDKASQIFAKMDANGDGAISKDEFSAFQASRKKRRGSQHEGGLATLMQVLDQTAAATGKTDTTTQASAMLAAKTAYKSAA